MHMSNNFIYEATEDIRRYKQTRDAYKKQYWLRSNSLDAKQRKTAKKLFMKIDRLRNHIKFWLKHLVNKRPTNSDSYFVLISRGRAEIQNSLEQLDHVLYQK